jgi:hypothetical protein
MGREGRVEEVVGAQEPDCPEPLAPGEPTRAEVVVLVDNGWAPYKREEAVRVPIVSQHVPDSYWERGWIEVDAVVKIALPSFESVPTAYSSFSVSLTPAPGEESAAGTSVRAERVQDLDALARWTLERRMPALVARSAIRATLKTVAVLKAQHDREKEEKKEGKRSGWAWLGDLFIEHIVPIAVSETEQADTRSWILLPSDIWMARVAAEPGVYELTLRPEGGEDIDLGEIVVRSGEKTFVSHRCFGSPHPVRCDD